MPLEWTHKPRKDEWTASVRIGFFLATQARVYRSGEVWWAAIHGRCVVNPAKKPGEGAYGFIRVYDWDTAEDAKKGVETELQTALLETAAAVAS